MVNKEEEILLEENEQYRISLINRNIRNQFAAGMPIERIVEPLGKYEGIEPKHILASLAIAENYKINPAEAMILAPSLLKMTHGEKFDLDKAVRDYFSAPGDYKLPFEFEDLKQFRKKIETEEAVEAREYEERPERARIFPTFSFGGFNQAFARSSAVEQQIADDTWFYDDKSKEKFIKGMLQAETEEDKDNLRRQRMSGLINEQTDRLQKLRNYERRRESMKKDSPGLWLSKYYALGTGVSRIRMASYEATGEVLTILGEISGSGGIKSLGEDMHRMSRAYWQAMQEPEITPTPANSFDRAVNSFLQNTPYVGLTVMESVILPVATPAFVFFNSASLEGTMIRQQAIDAGFSDESSRLRGWIGGTINGLIESAGGGAAKYNPKTLLKRIATLPKKMTNNALREVFAEEIPQEIVSMMLTGDVPYTETGEIDWDEFTNRMIALAGDTAFASAMFTAGSSAIGEYYLWDSRKLNKKFTEDVQAVMDNIMKEVQQIPEPAPEVAELAPAEAVEARKPEIRAEIPTEAKPAEAVEEKRLISKEAYEAAKKRLIDPAKMRAGIDPEGFKDLVTVGAYFVESGIRNFADWSKAMLTEFKEFADKIRPHLNKVWQEVRPDKEEIKDEIRAESIPDAPEIEELIATSESYGLQEQPDGKFAVIDWDTQQEIKTDLSKKQALQLIKDYNAGLLEPPKQRLKNILPTSEDIETMTHTQLLNVIFKKVSQQTRKSVVETTNAILQIHKDLVEYAKLKLEGLDITESQRNKLLRKVALAVTDKQKLQAVSVIQGITEIAAHRRAEAEFKKLRRLINRSANKRLSNGGIYHKVYDMLRELLNNYTTLSPKLLNSIKRTETYLDNLREDLSKNYEAKYAEGLIPRSIINKFRELSGTRIQDMNSIELEYLNEQIRRLLKISQLYNKVIQNRKIQEAKNFLNGAVATINLKEMPSRVKRFRPKRGKIKQIWDAFLGYRNDDVYTIFSKIWGKNDPITMRTIHMRQGQLKVHNQLRDVIIGYLDELGITVDQLKRWSPNMQSVQISQRLKEITHTSADLHTVRIGGIDRQLFMSEIMALYMHSKNNYNLRKIVKNGIGTYDLGIIGNLTKEEFGEILSIIENDPAAKAFCDKLQNFYEETARLGNEVSRRLDGMDLFREEDYFHIEYVPEGGVIGAEYVRDAIVDEEGRLKPRTSSNRPVILRDIFEVMAEDIFVMSHFIGMTEELRMLRSLVNYGPFRLKLRNAQIEHILKELDEKIGNIQKTRQKPSGAISRAVQRLGRGAARASLSLPNVWLYQPFSAALYLTEASDKYFFNMPRWITESFEKELLENWTLYRSRKESSTGSKSIGMRSGVRKMFTGKNSAADWQLSGLHKGDLWGVSRAALITRAEMSDKNMRGRSLEWWQNYGVNPTSLEYGSEQYWKAFNDRADYLVTLTQPMFFTENKGEYATSDNAVVREAARFRSFVDQILRIFHRQYSYAVKGDISIYEASRNMAIALLVSSLTKSIIKFGWDKFLMGKDKELEDLFADILTSPLQLVPFIGYPATKVAKYAMGRGLQTQPPSYSMLTTMLLDNILRHSSDVAKGVYYSTNDEYFQTGPNYGELKSRVYLKRGMKGILEDYLVMNGIPAYMAEQVEWWKED